MLAVWLPASQHCGLEAAGLIAKEVPHSASAGCCSDSSNPCTHDGCKVVESGVSKPAVNFLKAPAPSLAACLCFVCLQLVVPSVSAEPTLAVTESDHPKDWVAVWQFVRRAAPLSRAPSILG